MIWTRLYNKLMAQYQNYLIEDLPMDYGPDQQPGIQSSSPGDSPCSDAKSSDLEQVIRLEIRVDNQGIARLVMVEVSEEYQNPIIQNLPLPVLIRISSSIELELSPKQSDQPRSGGVVLDMSKLGKVDD